VEVETWTPPPLPRDVKPCRKCHGPAVRDGDGFRCLKCSHTVKSGDDAQLARPRKEPPPEPRSFFGALKKKRYWRRMEFN
jgi:hypothetical protein